MELLQQAFWAVAPSVLVGVILAVWNGRQKQRDQEQLRREQARVKSERLRISLLVSTARLSYAVAMAWKRGKPNGEVEVGVAAYDRAMEEFREYERELMAKGASG